MQPPANPSLVVVLVVDQMRYDYIERMQGRWQHGLKRLVTDGALFERNAYPYLQTVTCAGHATIGTGTFPATHGIILNAWWRGTRVASCTDDDTVNTVPYEPDAEAVGHSARELRVPTLADRIRERTPASRVVTLSIKPRSAIMLAGHGGVVTWLDDRNKWATSTAFADAPNADVQAFVAAHPRSALRDVVWERAEPADRYTGTDDAVGEGTPRGWSRTFPHPLAGAPGTTPDPFDNLWETSPYADEYLEAMAEHMVERMQLGKGEAVDYLGVSFSALDYVGHAFGPDSQEVQDTLLRLDATVGRLLDALDRTVGRGRYVVGLSADHGVAPVPEARTAAGLEAGRLLIPEILKVANDVLVKALGPGQHVARVEYTQVYLTDDARGKVAGMPGVLDRVADALAALPGVERVLLSDGLEAHRDDEDPAVRAAALSHMAGRSGQLVVLPKDYWVVSGPGAGGTTHGTHHAYDQRVPLVFFGAGIKPGRYQDASTPADLAPTLASTIGLPMPGTDGHAQTSALARP
ncbi:MAG: alkaline phosphatase family protein [Vicinamibacterales bacterium]